MAVVDVLDAGLRLESRMLQARGQGAVLLPEPLALDQQREAVFEAQIRAAGLAGLMKGGVALTDIQKLLGHQRSTTTDIYLHSIGNGLEEAMNHLEVK